MSKYKKPTNKKHLTFAIARLLSTVATISVLAIFIYYVAVEGWDVVIEWFNGKWFAFTAVFVVIIITICLWILKIYQNLKRLNESYEE